MNLFEMVRNIFFILLERCWYFVHFALAGLAILLIASFKKKVSHSFETMTMNERSTLLPGRERDEESAAGPSGMHSSKSVLLAAGILGCALAAAFLMIVGNTSPADSTANLFPMDRRMDQFLHEWESALYQSAQLVPLEGSSKEKVPAAELIYFNHSKAFHMLTATDPRLAMDFYEYQQGWDAQINQAFCGVASSMAAMNSLRGQLTSLPQDPVYEPFPWATQSILIRNECVKDTLYDIDEMEGQFFGIGLDMAVQLLNCHLPEEGFEATGHHADPSITNATTMRTVFRAALKDPSTRLLINYDRGGITQGDMGHGHFSPIAAYSYKTDSFLIMDVAKYKYPPVWVPSSKLWGGISTMDHCASFTYPDHPVDFSDPDVSQKLGCKSNYRGYIIITKDSEPSEEE